MWRSHSLQTLPDRKRREIDTSETIESQVRIISQMLLVCLSLQQSLRDDFTKGSKHPNFKGCLVSK